MDVVRRNTDYALRAMVDLAKNHGSQPISARVLSKNANVSYQLMCKLLQKLNAAGFVTSTMGPAGGYELAKAPRSICLADVIDVIQGPVVIIGCVKKDTGCPCRGTCTISPNLAKMQKQLEDYLSSVTLEQLVFESKQKGMADE